LLVEAGGEDDERGAERELQRAPMALESTIAVNAGPLTFC
jgi:hypothetical protein